MVKTSRASHAICIAKIKDEKYGLDGIYFFDPTWDAKYNSEEKNIMRMNKNIFFSIYSLSLFYYSTVILD